MSAGPVVLNRSGLISNTPRGPPRSPHPSDYMSRPVSLAKLAQSCSGPEEGERPAASNFSLSRLLSSSHEFCFPPVQTRQR